MCFDFRIEAIEGSEGEQKIYTATGTRNRVYPKQGVVSPDCEGIAEYNVHVAANLSSELTRSLYILLAGFHWEQHRCQRGAFRWCGGRWGIQTHVLGLLKSLMKIFTLFYVHP